MDRRVTPLLFGVGVTSLGMFADGYRSFLRRRNSRRKNPVPNPSLRYVGHGRIDLPVSDVYLVENVSTLVRVRALLAEGSTVVVADSPVLLSELPDLTPLDWQGDRWSFLLKPVDYAQFETKRAKRTAASWLPCIPEKADRLGLVIEETTGGLLSTPLNGICAQLNFADRHLFRIALARYLSGADDVKTFSTAARSLVGQSTGDSPLSTSLLNKLVQALKTTGPLYRQACATLRDKKNPTKLLKDTEVSLFEVRYFSKLVNTHAPVASAPPPSKRPSA